MFVDRVPRPVPPLAGGRDDHDFAYRRQHDPDDVYAVREVPLGLRAQRGLVFFAPRDFDGQQRWHADVATGPRSEHRTRPHRGFGTSYVAPEEHARFVAADDESGMVV